MSIGQFFVQLFDNIGTIFVFFIAITTLIVGLVYTLRSFSIDKENSSLSHGTIRLIALTMILPAILVLFTMPEAADRQLLSALLGLIVGFYFGTDSTSLESRRENVFETRNRPEENKGSRTGADEGAKVEDVVG